MCTRDLADLDGHMLAPLSMDMAAMPAVSR